MIEGWQVVLLLVPFVACVICGVAMAAGRTATWSGLALVGVGVVGAVGVAGIAEHASEALAAAAVALLVISSLVLMPLAVWAFPLTRWQHPVDFALFMSCLAPGCVAALASSRGDIVETLALVTVLGMIVQTWWRIERSDPATRRSLLWFSVASVTAAAMAGLIAFSFDGDDTAAAVAVCVLAVIPVAMVVGVTRPEAIDVRALVVLAVVGIVVAFGYLAYFVGVVAVADAVGAPEPSPAVLALIGLLGAGLVHPAAVVLRGVIDRMLFGDRPDPLDAAARVAGRIGDDPTAALDAVRDALALPYVALMLDGTTVAASGTEVTATRELPLSRAQEGGIAGDAASGAAAGEARLVVGLRAGDLRLTNGDTRVLRLVAPLLVQVLRAEAMADAVRLSRSEAIGAIADERRRLRRDLHDGLGPTLTGIAFSVDAARNLLRDDPSTALPVLDAIRNDTAAAIDQIRRLVYGMRPPALDELGLVPALRQQAAGLRGRDGTPLRVTVRAEGDLPELSAAVEVAAYRIVVEALTNVSRHARAGQALATVSAGPGVVVLEIGDDGGSRERWSPGVGLGSMRERAEEVGGTFECGPTPEGGRVRAALPLGSAGSVPAF